MGASLPTKGGFKMLCYYIFSFSAINRSAAGAFHATVGPDPRRFRTSSEPPVDSRLRGDDGCCLNRSRVDGVIPACAGMTAQTPVMSFPRRRESTDFRRPVSRSAPYAVEVALDRRTQSDDVRRRATGQNRFRDPGSPVRGACQPIFSSSLPLVARASSTRWASAAASSGRIRSMAAGTRPARWCSNISRARHRISTASRM